VEQPHQHGQGHSVEAAAESAGGSAEEQSAQLLTGPAVEALSAYVSDRRETDRLVIKGLGLIVSELRSISSSLNTIADEARP
jgi:hypothetical protein